MDKLLVSKTFIAGQFSLVAIERLYINSEKGTSGYWIAAQKELHAIIICDTNGIRAIDLDSNEVSLEELIKNIPKLDATLASLRSQTGQT